MASFLDAYVAEVNAEEDTTPPIGSIVINGGADYTNSTHVKLALTAFDPESGIKGIRCSNDGVHYEKWRTFTETRSWDLTSGEGTRTVYYQIRNNDNLISGVYNDSITLYKGSIPPSPTPKPGPTPTPSPEPTPIPTVTPTPSPTLTPTPSTSPNPTSTPTSSPSQTPTPDLSNPNSNVTPTPAQTNPSAPSPAATLGPISSLAPTNSLMGPRVRDIFVIIANGCIILFIIVIALLILK